MKQLLKAALYARVSTEEQVREGYSINAQKELLNEYASRNNIEIIEKYIDEGKSGKSIDGRPEMKRLLRDAKTGSFEIVIVYKLDRLARKTKDSLEIMENLESHNVQLVSYTENIDTSTPGGKMFFTLLSSLSEMERANIIDRAKMGMLQRAKEGYYNGGRVLGYDSVNKELVINEEEAHIIRQIFNYAEENLGYKAIVTRLNEMGYKTKQGRNFSINTVKVILDNPLHIGKIRFNLYENWSEKHRKGKNDNPIIVEGKHEAIIQQDQWDRVQQLRKKRSIRPARSGNPFILNGLVRCPECGYGMVAGTSKGAKGKRYRYYVCGLFHNKGSKACSAHSIRADYAEEYVFEELKRITSEPSVIEEIITNVNNLRMDAKTPINDEITLLKSKLNKVKVRINNITNKLMDEPELVNIFKVKLSELTEEEADLQERMSSLLVEIEACDTTPIDAQSLYNLLSDFNKVMKDTPATEQKALLKLIIKDIQISKEAPRGVGRTIRKINLHFDFTLEGLEKHALELLNTVNTDYIEPVDSFLLDNIDDKNMSEMMDSLNILPLKDVRFISVNAEGSVHLLK